jgi:hypothetical protein
MLPLISDAIMDRVVVTICIAPSSWYPLLYHEFQKNGLLRIAEVVVSAAAFVVYFL